MICCIIIQRCSFETVYQRRSFKFIYDTSHAFFTLLARAWKNRLL